MTCYYQGCFQNGNTREHIPPKSFFPRGQRNQLLTAPSCPDHNNAKSSDDTYVLAHICLNASPSNGAREVFLDKIAPQLGFNAGAFRKTLAAGAVQLPGGAVQYPVDAGRFDRFFSALSFGVAFKSTGQPLPNDYTCHHIYHNFISRNEPPEEHLMKMETEALYSGQPLELMNFGRVRSLNTSIYTVKLFGIPKFRSSLTIVHEFFGAFCVTSMLTKRWTQVQRDG